VVGSSRKGEEASLGAERKRAQARRLEAGETEKKAAGSIAIGKGRKPLEQRSLWSSQKKSPHPRATRSLGVKQKNAPSKRGGAGPNVSGNVLGSVDQRGGGRMYPTWGGPHYPEKKSVSKSDLSTDRGPLGPPSTKKTGGKERKMNTSRPKEAHRFYW